MTAEGGGMTPKDYSVEAQPASEDIANLEQMLEGMEFRAAPIELAALNRLFATARAKAQALEVRVAAAEQDTRPLARMVESWDGIAKAIREDARRTEFDERFRLETQARQLEACALELGAALSGLDRETPQ